MGEEREEAGAGLESAELFALARRIDAARAERLERLAALAELPPRARGLGLVLASAHPAFETFVLASPAWLERVAKEDLRRTRGRAALETALGTALGSWESLEAASARAGDENGEAAFLRGLRRFAQEGRARVALADLLSASFGGPDVDGTAREITLLAEVTIEAALARALSECERRFGVPLTAGGERGRFVVLGMGKLGGGELNPGSDVDLVYFYDTDEGAAVSSSGGRISLHDFWTRVARRMTHLLEASTPDGFAWRVDLRLRPEGASGPLVNSLAAAERYYESFGRTWERAALLRARPVAGDLGLGEELTRALSPFVWRRRVDPGVAVEMFRLVERARAELRAGGDDLKLGEGGIREAEFFAQTLQLVWGGREPRLRVRGTLDALAALSRAGYVTFREAHGVTAGYLALRRAEHAIQFSSGLQTHALPEAEPDRARLARALGFPDDAAFSLDLERHRARVSAHFRALLPEGAPVRDRFSRIFAALEVGEGEPLAAALAQAELRPGVTMEAEAASELARELLLFARHPDAPLGARSRETFPDLAETLLEALLDAADPLQAARALRGFFSRMRLGASYLRYLCEDPRAARRFVGALGASAFIGDAISGHPELADAVIFAREAPGPGAVRERVLAAAESARVEAAALGARAGAEGPDLEAEEEAVVSALRRIKARVTVEVGIADLAGEIELPSVQASLSALAESTIEAAARLVLDAPGGARGLSVVGVGKLGGRELGYGSDLDVFFVYDPEEAPPGVEAQDYFTRAARRIIRLLSVSHGAGPGYELDARLRPSGNQGLLVSSLRAFAHYHGLERRAEPASSEEGRPGDSAIPPSGVRAAPWERLALLRSRAIAGDARLGAEVDRLARAAAYSPPGDLAGLAREVHRIRLRMERERSRERRGRRDLKLGRGGLVDVEFCAQFLQIKHGADPRVRTTETAAALAALASAGYLAPPHAAALLEGHAFLRRLEQRIRIVHGDQSQLLEESAPGLVPLARRMGIRDRPGREAAATLVARYAEVTERIRAAYEAIVVAAGAEPGGA